MAGHRRARAAGQPLPPTVRQHRLANRRARLVARYAEASTQPERLQIAYDYLRGAAARRHPDPEQADALLNTAINALIQIGDQLLELQGREALRGAPPVTRSST